MADLQSLIRRAELDAEKLSASVRVIVFASLAVVMFSSGLPAQHALGAWAAIILYGIGTAIGLALAWRRILHPAIPYVFVTLDVVLVATHVLLIAGMLRMLSDSAFAVPAAALIFVILIHASTRYRPWLVVYAAALFVLSMEFGTFLFLADQPMMMSAMPMAGQGMMGVMNYQFLPVLIVLLAAAILFLTVRRTRRLLLSSIEQGVRTARLSRYFSPNVAARLAEGEDEETLKGRLQQVAVLFVDIRGFTSLAETMAPEELGAFLTEYRDRLAEPVFAHGGTVDKFIGDAIMAVFGSPAQREDDARRALDCALEIIEAAKRWSSERAQAGMEPVAIGVGGHFGEVVAGALGSDRLLEYTVIGDTVNVAERLERLSREVDSPLVVSAALRDAAGRPENAQEWRRLSDVELRGRRGAIEVFCLDEKALPESSATPLKQAQ
jgi:adenylate cyclase